MTSGDLITRLKIALPIVQAPMAGGPTTPELVAAVSAAGGLGSIGAGYLTHAQIAASAAAIRARSDCPFALNLFVGGFGTATEQEVLAAQRMLAPIRRELGLAEYGEPPSRLAEDLEAQIEAVLAAAPAVFSFTFGVPDAAVLERCRALGILTVGTATTVEEALELERAGVDAVCAQGGEAGGHRGTFLGAMDDALIGTMALVPQIVDRVRVPVIASGGIMDGRGIAAALALGAQAAQLGTAFLLCPEAGTSAPYRAALKDAALTSTTRVTRAFSGRHARGIVNRFMREIDAHGAELPPYPVQNALTREIRQAAAKAGRTEFLSLWAGQAAPMARELPAGELVRALGDELREALARLAQAARSYQR